MTNDWFNQFRRRVQNLLAKRPSLTTRLEELERSVSRLAREQAKANVEHEASNRTQGRLFSEVGQALRRLEEVVHRRHQIDAALIEKGRIQGRAEAQDESIHGMISLLDGLHQAIHAARAAGADQGWLAGLEAVRRRGEEALVIWEIEPTSAPGMAFNPEVHEAIGLLDGAVTGGPIIAEEVLRGYRQGDHIIRTAKVVVIRGEQDGWNRSGDDQLSSGGDRGGWQAPDS